MKKQNKFYKKRKLITLILTVAMVILLIILFLLLYKHSMAKYKEVINLSSTTEVANPVFIVDGVKEITIDGLEEQSVYNFSVKNYEENNISDVNMKYYVEIVNNIGNMISYNLSKDNKNINLKDNRTEEIKLTGVNKKEDNYELNINYDKSLSQDNEDITGIIQIRVVAVQEEI